MGDLDRVRYYKTQLEAAYKLIDHVVEDAKVWHEMPAHRRHGRLEYFSLLGQFMGSLRIAYRQGQLTQSQERAFRNLDRLARDALGTIKILRAKHAEMERLEGENGP